MIAERRELTPAALSMKRPPAILALVPIGVLLLAAGPPRIPPAPRTAADSLRVVVEPLFTRAKYDSVLAILPAYIRRAEATHDSVLLGRATTQHGRVMIVYGRFDDAKHELDRAIRIAESVRDTVGLMPALHFRGYCYTQDGRFDDALACFERRLSLALAKHSPVDEAWARAGIAYVVFLQDQYPRAKQEYTRAIELFRANNVTRFAATPLLGLGRVESALGNTVGAIRCYQSAWVVSREAGDRYNEMWATNNLGVLAWERGDLSRTGEYERRALQLARELKSPQAMLVPAANLVSQAEERGDFESAEATLNECRAMCEAQRDTMSLAFVNFYFANLRRMQDRPRAAVTLFRPLVESPALDPQNRGNVIVGLAETLAASDSLDAGIRMLETYVHRTRGTYAEAVQQGVVLLARLYARRGANDQALAQAQRAREMGQLGSRRTAITATFIESSRHRALGQADTAIQVFYAGLDSLEAYRGGISTSDLRETFGQQTSRDVVDAGRVLLEAPRSGPQAARDESFFNAMQRMKSRTLLDRITQSHQGATAPTNNPVCTLTELQRELSPGEVFLDFFLGSESAFVAAVTPDSLHVVALPTPGSPMFERLRLFRTVLVSDDASLRAQYSGDRLTLVQRALGRDILASVAALVEPARMIIVCPDGAFAAVPFGMLIMRDGGDVLMADHDVIQEPSASVLVRARALDRARRVESPVVVAIGARESRLLGARGEVHRLAAHYDGVRVVEDVAGVDAFQAATRSCDVLHVASHALVVDRSPWLSGIRLSAPPDTSSRAPDTHAPEEKPATILSAADSILIEQTFHADPYLRAWQIAPLRIPARLAVLASCETAGNRATTGEGTLGLTAAFLSSGVPVVVASMWPVEDRVTARVMRAFYHNLAAGKPVATALRLAQLEVSHSPRHAQPFYWAGFTVVGDGTITVGMKEHPAWGPLAITLIGSLLLIVAAVLSFSRRRRASMR
jgi:CHAT domain-containing protein/tetratricopeptide (TPR) repeat protein